MAPRVTTVQFLACLFAGFYTSQWSTVRCSELHQNKEDPSHSLTFLPPEGETDDSYLETTRVPEFETRNGGPRDSLAEDFLKPEPLVSDPLFEETPWNKSGALRVSSKRHASEGGWTHANKMQILQLHNIYRGNVTPPAGNMAYMEWDEELEELAQKWADRCAFEHGMVDNDYPDTIGQNLYIGTDPTGYLGLYMWYEEYHHYDLRKEHCAPYKQCGHYVQMAWSESSKLGCAMAKCNMRYYVVCHYSPQALRGVQMYRVAKPCSQCSPHMQCLKNLCISRDQCKNNPFECQEAKCSLECQNCGRLNVETCTCECMDGWDSPDCSHLCVNKHKRCGMSPGWPTKSSCSLNGYAVAKSYCRKMCEMCQPLLETSNDTCCSRKTCDDGFVLDTRTKSCKCVLLCPGPLCDGEALGKTQASLESRADYIKIIPHLVVFINFFTLWKTFLWKNI